MQYRKDACVHDRNLLQVLIVGGGDGGAVREIAKHAEVEEIHQCEVSLLLKS